MSRSFNIDAKRSDYKVKSSSGRSDTGRVYSEPEINALLRYYEIVNPSDYGSLPKWTHIRYKTKDGKFRRGGFIQNIWDRGDGEWFFQLQTKVGEEDASTKKWPVAFNNLDTVWKQRPRDDSTAGPAAVSPQIISTAVLTAGPSALGTTSLEAKISKLESALEAQKIEYKTLLRLIAFNIQKGRLINPGSSISQSTGTKSQPIPWNI